jgi:peptidyl-dipeptidase Dcp
VNPLLEPSVLFDDAPPFDALRTEHFEPAFRAALDDARARLDTIRAAEAGWDATIEALEAASEPIDRVAGVFFGLQSAESSPEMHAVARTVSPWLADFSSDLLLDPALFEKVRRVRDATPRSSLDSERARLLERTYRDFVRNGATLDGPGRERLRAIDRELAVLAQDFGENVRQATNAFELRVTDRGDLAGLPDAAIAAASMAAREKGYAGEWLITLQAPSLIPFLEYADRRDLREKLWRAHSARAFGDGHDNRGILLKLASLRHERARILGYDSHAAFVLEKRMAGSPARVRGFLEELRAAYCPAARKELDRLRGFAAKKGEPGEIQPWDFAYWREKLRKEELDFDREELRPWLSLDRVLDGIFTLSERVFGIAFRPASASLAAAGLPVYHPDVRVYEVRRAPEDEYAGLLYLDPHPRPGKRPGAWMTSYRDAGVWGGKRRAAHVAITCNVTRPSADGPALLSWDEATTFFHEFGHALHGLASRCRYRTMGGTNVYWDFVELPSQFLENFLRERVVLDLFARHIETGEPVPERLLAAIRESVRFFAGGAGARQLLLGHLDMSWHDGDPSGVTDVDAFESAAIEEWRILPRIEGANTSAAFSHIFAGGYAAGYYSYKWAEVLEADAFEAFLAEGVLDSGAGRRFRDGILARGDGGDPGDLYRAWRGSDPDPGALMRREGLAGAAGRT